MKTIKITTAIAMVTILGVMTLPAQAQHSIQEPMTASGVMMKKAFEPVTFTKKKYKIKGTFSIVEVKGQTVLRLSDDFKTKSGPDLKIFLSPQSSSAVTGRTATNGAISLGALTSNKGGSDYILPAGVNLADFQSVLVHCEAYSVLWGAADLG